MDLSSSSDNNSEQSGSCLGLRNLRKKLFRKSKSKENTTRNSSSGRGMALTRKGMNYPHVITSDLLAAMDRKNLLSLRLVNREWNELAITILIRHYNSHIVELRSCDQLACFLEVMEHKIQSRIPFSSFLFRWERCPERLILPILRFQGIRVSSLTFEFEHCEYNYDEGVKKILKGVPHLKRLTMFRRINASDITLKCLSAFVKLLPHLVTLDIYMRVEVGNDLEFCNFLESVSHLASISLSRVIVVEHEPPNTQYLGTSNITGSGARVINYFKQYPNLAMNLQDGSTEGRLMKILSYITQFLQTLRFLMPWPPTLRFPFLPYLEHLGLRFQTSPVSCTYLNPADFPSLKRVTLSYTFDQMYCTAESAEVQTPFGSAVFPTVKEFSYRGNGNGIAQSMNMDFRSWHNIFPNLITLRYYDNPNPQDVNYIATHLTRIQHISFHEGFGLNLPTFGLLRNENNTAVWPFSSLTDLKTLEFKFAFEGHCFSTGIVRNLVELTKMKLIQPLQYLLVQGVFYHLHEKETWKQLVMASLNWHKNVYMTSQSRRRRIGFDDNYMYVMTDKKFSY